ncbi:MAG TPA: alpha/beta fold hydrolase [Lapillicoccus sp.]|nr:alpha/beta fold hydrolase [Lapillicoccus sp.]
MPVPVLPGAEPYAHDGGDIGVLVVHGYTSTPQSVRGWAEHFAAAGYTVRVPRLPGHGTTWQEMNRTRWQDWYAEVDRAFHELRSRCSLVFAAGMSMGGLLATKLALEQGPRVAGLVLVNPIYLHDDKRLVLLPMLRLVVPAFPGIRDDVKKTGEREHELAYDRNPLQAMYSQTHLWAEVRRDLAEITQPVLLMHSRVDNVVPVASSAYLLEHISSSDVTEIWLEDSYHVATLDNDAPLIHDESVRFIERVSGAARADASEG